MKRILCFGDSNTWGYIPGSAHKRYNEDERWTKLLQKKLTGFEVIEEGLNSRTLFTVEQKPGKEGKMGYNYFLPCIDTHDKFDILIFMLGTNELKNSFNNSAEDIFNMFKKFVDYAINYRSKTDGLPVRLIVCGLPPVKNNPNLNESDDEFYNTSEKCYLVSSLYKDYCKINSIDFVDNTDLITGIDGVHLTRESHKILAEKLFNVITK